MNAADDFIHRRGALARLLAEQPPFEPPAGMDARFKGLVRAHLDGLTQADTLDFAPPPGLERNIRTQAARLDHAQRPRREAVLRQLASGRPAAEALGSEPTRDTLAWLEDQRLTGEPRADALAPPPAARTGPAVPARRPTYFLAWLGAGLAAGLALGVALHAWWSPGTEEASIALTERPDSASPSPGTGEGAPTPPPPSAADAANHVALSASAPGSVGKQTEPEAQPPRGDARTRLPAPATDAGQTRVASATPRDRPARTAPDTARAAPASSPALDPATETPPAPVPPKAAEAGGVVASGQDETPLPASATAARALAHAPPPQPQSVEPDLPRLANAERQTAPATDTRRSKEAVVALGSAQTARTQAAQSTAPAPVSGRADQLMSSGAVRLRADVPPTPNAALAVPAAPSEQQRMATALARNEPPVTASPSLGEAPAGEAPGARSGLAAEQRPSWRARLDDDPADVAARLPAARHVRFTVRVRAPEEAETRVWLSALTSALARRGSTTEVRADPAMDAQAVRIEQAATP